MRSVLAYDDYNSVMRSAMAAKRLPRYLIYGPLISLGLLLLCAIIRPDSLSVDQGLSYFGIYKLTVVPYGIALVIYAFCLWRASELGEHQAWYQRVLGRSLKLMALLVVGLLATPDTILETWHMIFGSSLFVLQLLMSLLILKWLASNLINFGLFILELSCGIAAWYYLPLSQGLLLQTQVIFQLAFVVLLLRTLVITSRKEINSKPLV